VLRFESFAFDGAYMEAQAYVIRAPNYTTSSAGYSHVGALTCASCLCHFLLFSDAFNRRRVASLQMNFSAFS